MRWHLDTVQFEFVPDIEKVIQAVGVHAGSCVFLSGVLLPLPRLNLTPYISQHIPKHMNGCSSNTRISFFRS